MEQFKSDRGFETPVIRYYIDIRPYAPIGANRKYNVPKSLEELPLLHTLPEEDRNKINRYHKAADRFMSLASALLKHLFIHRNARVPWSQVQISRTPKPHLRPYWEPPSQWQLENVGGLEFNVSHQAGIIVLVGCFLPLHGKSSGLTAAEMLSPTVINPDPTAIREVESEIDEGECDEIRLGVDIACTDESSQPANAKTQDDVNEWVDIFGEMFSHTETLGMKFAAVPATVHGEIKEKIRRFFTYWALKEAYIKMVGEGLLANWLRELEFLDVSAPAIPAVESGSRWSSLEDMTDTGLKVTFKSKDITHSMHTDIESFEDNFIVVTMSRGVKEKKSHQARWIPIDFQKDIRPCAEGRCSCLS